MDTIGQATCEILTTRQALEAVQAPLAALLRRLGPPVDTCARAASFCALAALPGFSHFMTAVWDGTDLRGLVYARQRRVLGFPIGMLQVGLEDCQDGGVIAPERDRPEILRIALGSLLPHPAIHTMTFAGDRSAAEHVCREVGTLPGLSSSLTPQDTSAILPLGDSFDAFLRSLGKHTRRTSLYHRRRAAPMAGVTSNGCPQGSLLLPSTSWWTTSGPVAIRGRRSKHAARCWRPGERPSGPASAPPAAYGSPW